MSFTRKDASVVMGMLSRGDKNQDIAAWFGENPARIVEIANGEMFGHVVAASRKHLPPKGAVGPKARELCMAVEAALRTLRSQRAKGVAKAISELSAGLVEFGKSRESARGTPKKAAKAKKAVKAKKAKRRSPRRARKSRK